MFIKHNSFFSYNGAHRYASTFIPWGHVLLNDKDYIDACSEIAFNIYNYLINVLEGEEFELLNNDFELDVIDKYLNYFQKKYKV